MTITINLLSILKFYLLGSVISLIIAICWGKMELTKHNFISAILFSWLNLIVVVGYIRDLILMKLKHRINTYIYCMLKNYLNFEFSKSYILDDYFFMKFIQKHETLGYQKHYFSNEIEEYGDVYVDVYNHNWHKYYDMVRFNFMEKYNK